MIKQIQKAYYFHINEFKMLLAIMGVKELFGFKIKTDKLQQQDLHKLLFELSKKELAYANENKFEITKEIEILLNHIVNAKSLWVFSDRAGEFPEKCIYLGSSAICTQICGKDNDIIRIEKKELQELDEYIVESGFNIQQLITDDTLYFEEKVENTEISELAKKCFELSKSEILEQKDVKACLAIYSLYTRKKQLQILLLGKGIEDYIAVSDINSDDIYAYSEKKLKQIINMCIGGE